MQAYDGAREVKKVPMPVAIIVIALVIGGFAFLYRSVSGRNSEAIKEAPVPSAPAVAKKP